MRIDRIGLKLIELIFVVISDVYKLVRNNNTLIRRYPFIFLTI